MSHEKFFKKSLIHTDTFFIVSLLLFVLIVIAFVFSYYGTIFPSSKKVDCTSGAQICPDGTSVSRTAPLCEFASCEGHLIPNRPGITEEPLEVPKEIPIEKTNKVPKEVMCTEEAKICPDGSFVGRTGPKCEFASCPILTESELEGDL